MPKPLFRLVATFCLGFVAAGTYLGGTGLARIVEGCRAAERPTTVGTIESSVVSRRRTSKSHTSEVKVAYSYVVDGRTYRGHEIHPCYGSSSDDAVHERLAAELPPGTRVRVRYCPDDPRRACLAAGFFTGGLTPVFGGALFVCIGGGLALLCGVACPGGVKYEEGIEIVAPAD